VPGHLRDEALIERRTDHPDEISGCGRNMNPGAVTYRKAIPDHRL
jgi:hypothetical protein